MFLKYNQNIIKILKIIITTNNQKVVWPSSVFSSIFSALTVNLAERFKSNLSTERDLLFPKTCTALPPLFIQVVSLSLFKERLSRQSQTNHFQSQNNNLESEFAVQPPPTLAVCCQNCHPALIKDSFMRIPFQKVLPKE